MAKNDVATNTIVLPEVLDLKAAQPLVTQLLAVRGTDITIDASAVTFVGAQCLQVLYSADATWRADDSMLAIHDPTGSFAAHIAGLGDHFEPQSLKELCR